MGIDYQKFVRWKVIAEKKLYAHNIHSFPVKVENQRNRERNYANK